MFQGLSPTSIVVFLWWGGVAGDVQNVLTLLSSFSVVEYTRGRPKDPASFWQLSLVEILTSCFNGSAKASMHNNDEKARRCRCGNLQIPRCQAVGIHVGTWKDFWIQRNGISFIRVMEGWHFWCSLRPHSDSGSDKGLVTTDQIVRASTKKYEPLTKQNNWGWNNACLRCGMCFLGTTLPQLDVVK